LSDSIIKTMQGHDKSFLVFSHVVGQSPHIGTVRTLKRERTQDGVRYVRIDHWRQQRYLLKLLYAAYHKGLEGAWPDEEEMAALMNQITNWLGWYDLQGAGYVNSFPGKLINDEIGVTPLKEGDRIVSFVFDLILKESVTGPLELTIG